MCLHCFVKYSSLNMVRVKGLRTLPVRGITSTDVLIKYKLVDFLQPIFQAMSTAYDFTQFWKMGSIFWQSQHHKS